VKEPTPESLALVGHIRACWQDGQFVLTANDATRRIDGHVAEQCEHANARYFSQYAACLDMENKLTALRAAADAMAREVEIVLDMLPCNIPELDDALAAYRVISPHTE
jgi:hypothetical protein